MHARRHPAFKPAPLNGQGKSPLHFLARPHTPRTDDTFRRVIGEIRVALVLGHIARVFLAILAGFDVVAPIIAITHIAQANRTGHIL